MTNGDGPVPEDGQGDGGTRRAPSADGTGPRRTASGIPEQQARPHPEEGAPDAAAEPAGTDRRSAASPRTEAVESDEGEAPVGRDSGPGAPPGGSRGRAEQMSEHGRDVSQDAEETAHGTAGTTGPAGVAGVAAGSGEPRQEAGHEPAGTGRPAPHDPHDRSGARALFVELRTLPAGSPEYAELRNRLVRMHLPLVEHLARRFRNRGEPLDDLTQVATIGLIKSVDRFDPERGVEFSTYATPTVVGEIKRHFRDKGWAVRVPRRLQELRLSLTTATAELSQLHGRSPTVHELAEKLGISEEEVLEGLESANAYSTLSLDVPDTDDESPAVADTLGAEDEALEGVEYRESLKPLLEDLPPREKRILLLRFFGNMTQSQIAQEVGISQMHVSRLLARTLAQLREKLLVEE
ncbi:SigB/SigF/SigG family RNA polymerase sigma factor [Streptomyces sp. NPDC058045]|uniref:SigB/SigF/SigG family RNA polymerase sigma factor n=1 Tax=Streptomyces sp. NPDC058045 TaxID=3346311 RepID=UPI0036EE0E63